MAVFHEEPGEVMALRGWKELGARSGTFSYGRRRSLQPGLKHLVGCLSTSIVQDNNVVDLFHQFLLERQTESRGQRLCR